MGLTRMGPPEDLTLALRVQLRLTEFVETGTFQGHTAAWAARHFSRVTTIELSPAYHAAAQARFRGQANLRTLQGDSGAVLRELIPRIMEPALFWLDAHWSGLDTAGRESECPLLAEVAAINTASTTHTILVDDARLFCSPPPRPHRAEQWPDLLTTLGALADRGRRHVVLWDDVLIAVPAEERDFLNRWLQDKAAAPSSTRTAVGWWKKLRG